MPALLAEVPELTPDQRYTVTVNFLQELSEGGTDLIPLELFNAMSRLMTLATVEVGMFQPATNDQAGAILLGQRSADDPFWASQWHVPGSIIRANDPVTHEGDYDAAMTRALREVGEGVEFASEPHEQRPVRRTGPRGSEITVRFICEVAGIPTHGRFFPFDEAGRLQYDPQNDRFIDGHVDAAQGLATAYLALT